MKLKAFWGSESVCSQLIERGYDLSTLKFSIEKTPKTRRTEHAYRQLPHRP